MSARRLWVLVSQLPPDSAVARVEGHGWTTEHELLASLIESIDAGLRNLYVATLAPHSKQTPKPWDPVLVPRPGTVQVEPSKPPTIAEIQAMFLEDDDG